MRNLLSYLLLTGLIMNLFTGRALAQATNASILGVITDNTNQPIAGASIILRNESTGFTTSTSTNNKGEYLFQQLPLGKPYTVTVKHLIYAEAVEKGHALNQGDLLRLNFTMKESSTMLAAVDVSASTNLKNTIRNLGASTAVTSRDLERLPVNGRNFTSLINLSPLSNGNQLSGQIATSTNFTIDGMTSRGPLSGGTTNRGPYSVSMEAIREFEIATNQYDVTYGRAGGGTISTVTKSGTNTLTGSVFGYGRTAGLASPYDIRGNRIDQEYSTYQFGFSLGGPIVKDKAHFFVALDQQQDSRPFYIADIRTPADEARLNVTQSTLDQFLDIARNKYGVAGSQQIGAFDRKRPTTTLFARVDWQLNEKNLLTIRNNYVRDMNNQGVSDNSAINIYEVYGSHLSTDNSFMASLRTSVAPKVTNELKAQYLYTLDDGQPSAQLPSSNIPRAIVQQLESTVDGKTVNTTVQLGGQRYLPEVFKNHVFQVVDNLYWTKNNINYTFGVDLMYTKLSSLATSEMNGRFFFSGMENFNNLTPFRYAREVSLVDDPTVNQSVLNSGLYAQAQSNLGNGLDLTLGLRADYTHYFDKPVFNQAVFNALKLNTDNGVTTFQLQPRFQLTWDIGERQTDILRVGGGIFGSNLNNYSMVNNMLNDGTKVASVDISGAQLPTPNFPGYREDPLTAPGQELFNLPGVEKVSTINMNSKDIKVPTLYKANISYNRFITDRFRVGATFLMSFARNNYMYVDRNMKESPFFRLANEGNRGVFVPATGINAKNGAADWTTGRESTAVSRVLELVSEGKIDQYALVLDATARYYKDGQLTVSYTWNDTKDNTSYNGNVANTATLDLMVADDPRDLSTMAYSNNHFRNKVVVYGTLPSFYGVSFGVRYSGIGGKRYSVAVNGNVNGDFVNSNDLAFIFDPNDAANSQAMRDGIQGILDNPEADRRFKDYLSGRLGQLAERNGVANGFYGVWDIRASKKFKIHGSHAIEVSADIFNFANLLNKEWGVDHSLTKQNLTTIRGFDRTNNQYIYQVNPNAGVSNLSGNPYQVQLGLRYSF
ncbi:TonB-dependent receptor [Sphingobacterium multivorum]|uniref:TonB-dependent receptor n=1 Tax=Sphingobacterium multivorum TaxID=28454 RepID=UPI0028A28B75|nr:carboxypeptidase regulatory-like domain-containing protein [Sphingobacterium multivorum]